MSDRVTDYALLIGHAWRCSSCRETLLQQPQSVLLGIKLNDTQRQAILKLTEESFTTIMRLSAELELTSNELHLAIDHPRARLRHLGVMRGEQRLFIRP